MKCKIVKPRTTTYQLRFSKEEDPGFFYRCLWADITLDRDNFRLTASTDCGDYSYSWSVTENETFLNLMCRISKEYLLGKISSRSEFNFDESKRETIENLREWYEDDIESKELDLLINEINEIEDSGEEVFYRGTEAILPSEVDSFETISIEKDYPCGAQTFAYMFEKYLQPILQKENKEVRMNE